MLQFYAENTREVSFPKFSFGMILINPAVANLQYLYGLPGVSVMILTYSHVQMLLNSLHASVHSFVLKEIVATEVLN